MSQRSRGLPGMSRTYATCRARHLAPSLPHRPTAWRRVPLALWSGLSKSRGGGIGFGGTTELPKKIGTLQQKEEENMTDTI